MSEKKREAMYCIAATLAVLLVVVLGAMFLIAPVWQPGYHVVGFHITSTAVKTDTRAEANSILPETIEPIELNTATEQELMQLSGIGEGKAAAIVEYRQQNGDFSVIDDLVQVPGISQKMVDGWAEQIYITPTGN